MRFVPFMDSIYYTPETIMIVWLLVIFWKFYTRMDTYYVTHISICSRNLDETNADGTKHEVYDNVILTRVFSEKVIDGILLHESITTICDKMKDRDVSYLDYANALKQAFIDILSKMHLESGSNDDFHDIQTLIMTTFDFGLETFIAPNKKTDILSNGHRFFMYRWQMYDFIWQILVNISDCYPLFAKKLIYKKRSDICVSYMDNEIAKTYKNKILVMANYNTKLKDLNTTNELLQNLYKDYAILGSNNFDHCLIDLTSLCIDLLTECVLEHIENRTSNIQKKMMQSIQIALHNHASQIMDEILYEKSKLQNCHRQKYTVVFDTLSILEHLTINFAIPKENYTQISNMLISLHYELTQTFCKLWNRHKIKGSFEVLDKFDLLKLKVMGHRNTEKLNKILAQSSSLDVLIDFKKLIIESVIKKSIWKDKWVFKNSLFENIIDTCVTSKELLDLHAKTSKMVIGLCKNCKEDSPVFCDSCSTFIKLFGLEYIRIECYRRSLNFRTKYNYYNDMEEAIKYSNKYKTHDVDLINGEDINTSLQSASTQRQNVENKQIFCDGKRFEMSQEDNVKVRKNKIEKVIKIHISSKDKILRQIQEEKERKTK